MRAKRSSIGKVSTETVIMDGGYNENISSLELGGGELIYGLNYYLQEGSLGGYVSVPGYERYDGTALASTVDGDEDDDTAREARRTAINEVPGTGNVLGLHLYNSNLYAFRNEVTNTTTEMYVDSGSGWTKVDLGSKMTFDTGATSALTVGETLTGGTSTATGTLLKVVISSGTIAGGDAAGYIIIDVLTGTFQSGEALTGGTSSGTINSTSLAVAQTITKDGTYHFVNHNFYATSGKEYMYFTNGVNSAMVYDGTAFDFIVNSGMGSDDKPDNLVAHNDRLFLSYPGGSLQYSTLGDPEDWTTSPGELGMGKEISGLLQAVANALVIFCDDGIRVLNGTSDSDTWQLEYFSQDSGAYEFTPHRMFGTIFFMNDRGVTTLSAVQDFGDFKANTISQKIYKTLQRYKSSTTVATVHRDKNQYRVFFSSGLGAIFSFTGPKFRGVTLIEYPDPVNVTASGKDSSGNDLIYFSSTDGSGYVYKMDSGTSFDGEEITSRLTTAYYSYKSPRLWKKFISATIEIHSQGELTLTYRPYYDYDSRALPRSVEKTTSISSSQDVWGGANWGTMIWSTSQLTNRSKIYLHGMGSNMAISIGSTSKYDSQHTIQNMTTDFEATRRQL